MTPFWWLESQLLDDRANTFPGKRLARVHHMIRKTSRLQLLIHSGSRSRSQVVCFSGDCREDLLWKGLEGFGSPPRKGTGWSFRLCVIWVMRHWGQYCRLDVRNVSPWCHNCSISYSLLCQWRIQWRFVTQTTEKDFLLCLLWTLLTCYILENIRYLAFFCQSKYTTQTLLRLFDCCCFRIWCFLWDLHVTILGRRRRYHTCVHASATFLKFITPNKAWHWKFPSSNSKSSKLKSEHKV